MAQIEDLNEDCLEISRSYLLCFPINKLSRSVKVGSGRFIVLNDSACPKMIIQIYFNFFKGFRAV